MLAWIVFSSIAAIAPQIPANQFDQDFTGRTLRFDYHHAGTATAEEINFDQLRLEGAWPGSRKHLVDHTNLGKYLFVVVDLETQRTLWSRGFCSIFGEWETTGEAKTLRRSFEESQRFPEPRRQVQLVLKKRDTAGAFREIFTTVVDPTSRAVNRAPVSTQGTSFDVAVQAPAANAVDLLVLADGYTAEQVSKFRADVTRLSAVLLDTEPFKSHRARFNVRALHLPAAESGISNPRKGVWKAAPFGTSFNAFDSDRYVLTFTDRVLREAAAQVPYDTLIILSNEAKYGGGGIFNLYATCTSDTEPSAYVFVHEFGHSFAGLADEYYTSQVAYENFNPPGTEPWEPNVTALKDPKRVKWAAFVEAETPLPTPWGKEAYDQNDLSNQKRRAAMVEKQASEEDMNAYFRDVKATSSKMLRAEPNFGRVGAFEGAFYESRGYYRPEVDCIMFTRNPDTFCRVCRLAIERVLALHAE